MDRHFSPAELLVQSNRTLACARMFLEKFNKERRDLWRINMPQRMNEGRDRLALPAGFILQTFLPPPDWLWMKDDSETSPVRTRGLFGFAETDSSARDFTGAGNFNESRSSESV
jgi:hypothetical protein